MGTCLVDIDAVVRLLSALDPDLLVDVLADGPVSGKKPGAFPALRLEEKPSSIHSQDALEDIRRDEDPDLVKSALAVLAFARGLRVQGRVLSTCTDDEIEEFLDEV